MEKERIEVFFDTLRPELPDYIIDLEKEALRDEVPVIRRGTRDLLYHKYFILSWWCFCHDLTKYLVGKRIGKLTYLHRRKDNDNIEDHI